MTGKQRHWRMANIFETADVGLTASDMQMMKNFKDMQVQTVQYRNNCTVFTN
jgi:hypothetical protein